MRATESQTEEPSEEKDDAGHRPRLTGKSLRATDFVLGIEDGFCGAAVDLLRLARQQKVSPCSKIELAPAGMRVRSLIASSHLAGPKSLTNGFATLVEKTVSRF
jgi:hypothetical protein